MSSGRIAIIAAMQTEIAPLLEIWRRGGKQVQSCELSGMMPVGRAYTCGEVLAISAGIGRRAAAAAAKAAIEHHEPETIISAGMAGALKSGLAVGSIVSPAEVVDVATGQRYRSKSEAAGTGVLISAAAVLSHADKEEMASRFGADAVDMEAAVVAEIAGAAGVRFMAVKAISDGLDFEMPPLGQFIDSNGRLHLLKLLGYAALRPQIWPVLNQLRRNSQVAAQALARELERVLAGTRALPLGG